MISSVFAGISVKMEQNETAQNKQPIKPTTFADKISYGLEYMHLYLTFQFYSSQPGLYTMRSLEPVYSEYRKEKETQNCQLYKQGKKYISKNQMDCRHLSSKAMLSNSLSWVMVLITMIGQHGSAPGSHFQQSV